MPVPRRVKSGYCASHPVLHPLKLNLTTEHSQGKVKSLTYLQLLRGRSLEQWDRLGFLRPCRWFRKATHDREAREKAAGRAKVVVLLIVVTLQPTRGPS